MRADTVTTKVYQFEELSEQAKENARNWWREGGLDYEWWNYTYEDAENIGLKITSFDLYRQDITGEWLLSACEVAQNILNDHGPDCETYKTATNFMDEWQPVFNNYMDENHADYEGQESEEKLMDMEHEFLYYLLEDYRIMLSKEYDWLNSDEYIDETIIINEYEFTADGNIY